MNNRLFAPPSLPGFARRDPRSLCANGSTVGLVEVRHSARRRRSRSCRGRWPRRSGRWPRPRAVRFQRRPRPRPLSGSGSAGIDEAGEVRFSGGNILLGGDASDIIEGRGGNDVIDGDAWLNVRIERVDDLRSEAKPIDTMAGFQAARAGWRDARSPTSRLCARSRTPAATDIDIAEFSGVRADYEVEGITTSRRAQPWRCRRRWLRSRSQRRRFHHCIEFNPRCDWRRRGWHLGEMARQSEEHRAPSVLRPDH